MDQVSISLYQWLSPEAGNNAWAIGRVRAGGDALKPPPEVQPPPWEAGRERRR